MNRESSAPGSRKSDVWWHPLARRVAGWGLAGAALWAGPVALFLLSVILAFALWETIFPPPPDPDDWSGLWVVIACAATVVIAATFAVLGAVAGGVCGFFAPPADAKNPFQSRFFRGVNRQTFCLLAATSLSAALTLGALLYPTLGFVAAFLGWLAFSIVLFALSLWRAVNCALRPRY